MPFIVTKKGVVLTVTGNTIMCSDGKLYTYMETCGMLSGPCTSYNVKSMEEAIGIVIGLYGGKTL